MDIDANSKRRIIPWVEKYRPATVDEVSHQDEVVRTLKTSIEQGNLPHLLFHGPPGTGKTTTILAVARALYGPELYRSRLLELNASDDRGISVVREKIKTFAQGAVGGQRTSGYPCPKFKLIILDEADTMTPEAQSALRRIMEAYSKVTRFCLVCNYVTRIIEPLASRCAKFRFKPLPASAMIERMRQIIAIEKIPLAGGALDAIMACANGDMRRAVTYLQSCHQLSTDSSVTVDTVMDICGQVPPRVLADLWDKMANNRRLDLLRAAVSDTILEGYPVSSLLLQLHDRIVTGDDVPDVKKALICEKIAQVDQNLIDGANEQLQLSDLAAFIMRTLRDIKSDLSNIDIVH